MSSDDGELLDVRWSTVNGWQVLSLAGEVDVSRQDELYEELSEALRTASARVVLDLTKVSYIDSSGLSAIAVANREAQEAGALFRVAGSGGFVTRLLRTTGLDTVLDLHPTVEAAARSA
ncbi:STAS domain-containing protein [Allokutzneria sp. A3M-2-11 16]|uniref:STAS domain-containing protein n=1 Tax=Allokutzneria sp. A3M-2-11 16 TaxID=2962043 RepID=UPI0020B83942|nr:STAS domain-containing protein [Allokutzneria sp. A3M-2-11 16]MCP3802356.1 STAS domain-containing protein [Allokutzneria sp. A3M-2-11 16]